jgi:ribose transport system permease protein
MKTTLRRLLRTPLVMDYGMLFILVLVCGCLSWATYREGNILGGKQGAELLAALAADTVPHGTFVVAESSAGEESAGWPDLDTLLQALQGHGCTVATTIPPAASLPAFRRQLENLYSEHPRLDGFILMDPSRERWLQDALRRAGVTDRPPIITPVRQRESVFLKLDNLRNIVRQASVIAIVAAGMTMVIITGGIDLSVGSLIAFSGVVTALCLKQAGGIPLWGLITLVLLLGCAGGLGLGAGLGRPRPCLLAGFMVAVGIAFGLGHLAQNRILGITPRVPDTVEALVGATNGQGSVFLFFDGGKPGAAELTAKIKEELAVRPGIRVIGERSVSPAESDELTESIEERARRTAEEVLEAYPDVRVLFGADRDIFSGLERAIDAAGATTRLTAVGAVTDRTGLVIYAVLAGLLVGCAGGALSGVVITGFRIPPFIATLAMMLIARGLSRYLCKGVPIWDLPEQFEFLGNGYLFEGHVGAIPVPVAVMVAVYVVGHLMLSRTKFGRYLYAVGGNEEATRLSGIPINMVKLAAYIITGGLSAVAGIIMAARLQCGHPETGALYELYVIAACVVGGASLMGGQGKIFGSLIGALLIWVIFNGLNLMNVNSYLQQAFLGLVIFMAVLLDQAKKRLST